VHNPLLVKASVDGPAIMVVLADSSDEEEEEEVHLCFVWFHDPFPFLVELEHPPVTLRVKHGQTKRAHNHIHTDTHLVVADIFTLSFNR
jgi:hypothetical protein